MVCHQFQMGREESDVFQTFSVSFEKPCYSCVRRYDVMLGQDTKIEVERIKLGTK